MIRIILYLAAIAVSAIAEAQVTENRSVPNFTGIHASSGVQVVYTPSSTTSVKVESDNQDKINQIVTEVRGGELKVYVKHKKGGNTFKTLKAYVSAPDVKAFKAQSGSHITLENELNSQGKVGIEVEAGSRITGDFVANSIDINVESGSGFSGKLIATNVSVELESGSTASVSGKADKLKLEVSAASNFSGKDLTVKSAIIQAANTSVVDITVTESLTAEADSLSFIDYYGNPKHVDTKATSLGKVNKK